MTERMSIAIDMDDVLAETMEQMIALVNDWNGTELAVPDLYEMESVVFQDQALFTKLLEEFNKPGFARNLGVKPHAIDVVERLNERYDIYIATAAMEVPGTFQDKFHWLAEHFPFLSSQYFIFCGNKKVVQADFLIDDTAAQLRNFTGIGVLYDAPFNQSDTDFVRIKNWKAAEKYFLDDYEDRLADVTAHRFERFQEATQ